MEDVSEFVPYPLYHGTSSHYLACFKPGTMPTAWPYKDVALGLLRDTWTALQAYGDRPTRWIENVLNQTSGPTNWQHGELYLTPSKTSAVRYARTGAAHGGELLTCCKQAIDALAKLDKIAVECLFRDARPVAKFLQGGGWPPILVQFDKVPVDSLMTEIESRGARQLVCSLADEGMRESVGQQTNFRLASYCGTVSRVFEIAIKNDSNPLPSFALRELHASDFSD